MRLKYKWYVLSYASNVCSYELKNYVEERDVLVNNLNMFAYHHNLGTNLNGVQILRKLKQDVTHIMS